MDLTREQLLDLADRGLCMPIGTDLVLRQRPDAEAILLEGGRLGAVVAESARHYGTPLALPLMDLSVEKQWLLSRLGVRCAEPDAYHFTDLPDASMLERFERPAEPSPRLKASIDAVRHIATETKLAPIGMAIGPFSLLSKLLTDPITPVFLAGAGATAADDPEVALLDGLLELSLRTVLDSIDLQCRAGARAVFIAEPAGNKVYFSPNQLQEGSDVFEHYVLRNMRRIVQRLHAHGAQLLFHCCGELVESMVRDYGTLRPLLMSLGSSRKLWSDAALLPKDVVLYGNLPSKRFYSDESVSQAQVERMADELIARMKSAGHPFILGSECDVLSVEGCGERIRRKTAAITARSRYR